MSKKHIILDWYALILNNTDSYKLVTTENKIQNQIVNLLVSFYARFKDKGFFSDDHPLLWKKIKKSKWNVTFDAKPYMQDLNMIK